MPKMHFIFNTRMAHIRHNTFLIRKVWMSNDVLLGLFFLIVFALFNNVNPGAILGKCCSASNNSNDFASNIGGSRRHGRGHRSGHEEVYGSEHGVRHEGVSQPIGGIEATSSNIAGPSSMIIAPNKYPKGTLH
uniref:Uncharacterized protein n=1 Tax=Meloidogyne javanica TaxID=6303 RepID=A0A915LL34_MELJA